MIHEQPTHPDAPNAEVAAGLRDLAAFLDSHPELPAARWASVSLRAVNDRQPARETLELVARALGGRAAERRTYGGDVEIVGKFGPCALKASASVAELRLPEPAPLEYEPIIEPDREQGPTLSVVPAGVAA